MHMMLSRAAGNATLFQALVEHSSDAVVLLDRAARVVYASHSVERVTGYRPEERLGRSAFELIHAEDRAVVSEAFDRVSLLPGVPVTCEFRLCHKEGTWHHVEAVAVNRLATPDVGGIVVNYRDVTKRKEAEQALRESERRLRELFDNALDLIYYCSPSGLFTYVNPSASRVMRYPEAELIGRHFLTLIRPDFQQAAAEHYRRQLAERTPNSYFEFPAVTSDNTIVWLGQHVQLIKHGGEIVGVQAIARDISKQRDAEERLRRSEARYRSLIEGAEYGIYCTDRAGAIHAANPAFARMLGYESIDDLRSLTMNDVYASPQSRAEIIDRYVAEGVERLTGNVIWKKKDGTEITVRVSGRRVDLGDGVMGFEAIAEDITARRAMEQQLRQSQKMEAVGRLARGIAHDFNNVLAAVVGCSELLQARLAPDDPSYVDALEIGKAASRGAALTRQLLAFSRRQPVQPQVLDVHAVLGAFDSMLRRLSQGVVLRLHTPSPAPLVRLEAGQLEQIVMNLVLNARDAVSDAGAIDVLADVVRVGPDAALKYPGLPDGDYARIVVHDCGCGIEPDLQRHVFEPFFSTKDPARGTGLGLSIIYGIAKEAGGTVTFVSTPGSTTFEVLLPIAEP
jgi:PAS domain S-box-containing protein